MKDDELKILTTVESALACLVHDLKNTKTKREPYNSSYYDLLSKGQILSNTKEVHPKTFFERYSYGRGEFIYMKSSKNNGDKVLKVFNNHNYDSSLDLSEYNIEFDDKHLNRVNMNFGRVVIHNNDDKIHFRLKDNEHYNPLEFITDNSCFRDLFVNTEETNFIASINISGKLVNIRNLMQEIFKLLK